MSALAFKPRQGKGITCPDCPKQRSAGRFWVFMASWPVLTENGTHLCVCRKCRKKMEAEYEGALNGTNSSKRSAVAA